ncbi:MAG: ATP-binding protein [Anaeromyxobacter sp.]
MKEPHATHFAPAALASDADLGAAIRQVADNPLLTQLLEAVGSVLLVINAERQVVAANEGALRAAGIAPDELPSILGLRIGESFGCLHVESAPNGCGTGHACSSCGVARAIVDSQINHRIVEYECAIRTARDGFERTQEYSARVSPLTGTRPPLFLVTLHDIADKKRREALERVFLHDLMNTLSAVSAYRCLAQNRVLDEGAYLQQLNHLIARVIDEVKVHRTLLDAEHEQPAIQLERLGTRELVEALKVGFEVHEQLGARQLSIECCDEFLESDRTLLLRVLTNMLKNAFEATAPKGTVTLRCFREDHHVVFSVSNPGMIPEEIASHIFTRSFSTKGESGRGFGTYSMRLFGERFLHGKVRFTTSQEEGTSFFLCLPLRPASAHALVRERRR